MLKQLRLGHSLATPDAEMESILDWEISQYRFSDRVICRSVLEAELLAEIGVDADVVSITKGRLEPATGGSRTVFVPGAVSRLNAFPELLRATAGLDSVSVVFGPETSEDRYWHGSTWEAFEGARRQLGGRIARSSEPPEDTDLVILGNPFSNHEAIIRRCIDRSVPVSAPRGSVAVQQWEGISEWRSDDDLAAIVQGQGSRPRDVAHQVMARTRDENADEFRARSITVGIPVYGDAPYLDELIQSIIQQTRQAHELILVLDGRPGPGVVDQIASVQAEFAGDVAVFEQPNRGVCVARNSMLDAMSGDAVMLVDQDDVLDTRALELLSEAMRSNPQHDVVACWTEFFGEYNAIEAKPPFDRRVGYRENPIVSTAALIDRAAIDSEARFEPDLAFLYCEDWNFWAELVFRDHAFALVPRPLVRHRVHNASGGFRRTDHALAAGRDRARRKLLQ